MDSQVANEVASAPTRASHAAGEIANRGLQGLIAATQRYIDEEGGNTPNVVRRLSEDFAYIRLQDVKNPYKFLRQMEGHPPIRLGTQGFRPDLVDDLNPARHYMAFVAMGYWLPYWLAMVVLYAWEIAGWLRYRFQWSEPDMLSGRLGVRHGNAVRHHGIHVLPELMASELGEDAGDASPKSGETKQA